MTELNHGTTGQLISADGTRVEVAITERREDILLAILGEVGTLFDHPLEGMVLESTAERGVIRTRGSGQRVDEMLVRFFVADTANVVQRRQFVRVVAPQRIVLEDAESDELLADTIAVNISGGGALLKVKKPIETETHVYFELFLEDSFPPVTGQARVIRATEDSQQAIVFEQISRVDRERLIHFIFERQRHALAVTRGDAL
jgi:hypothetical protein